jgi:hypothetical protein
MMLTTTWILTASLAAVLAQAPPAAKAEPMKKDLERPTDWIVRQDEPSGETVYFVKMPPGWHITTGPGSILYQPDKQAAGRYRVEAEIFLFPGKSGGGHGIFFGGRQLDDKAQGPTYWAFLLYRDGSLRNARYENGRYSGGSKGDKHPAVVPSSQEKAVKNVLAIEIDGSSARLLVNGQHVGTTTSENLQAGSWDGTVGLRVDPDVNLHVTRLDVTELK